MTRTFTAALFYSFFACVASARANVKLPAIFSDHMVVQAGSAVLVWGWAEPGEEVTVSLAGQSQTAKAGAQGKWQVKLDKLQPVAEAQTLTVKGRNTLVVKDVLVGEVWLGSGQSNMAMTMVGVKNSAEEIAAANFPAIRMFKVTSTGALGGPQEDCTGAWQVCSPATVKLFSATAYFFGRELHRTLGMPVGLINSSVGGTPIESWISLEAQLKSPELKASAEAQVANARKFDAATAKAAYEKSLAEWKAVAEKAKAEGKAPPSAPRDPIASRQKQGEGGGLFNGKIAPLIPYALRGVIWYQGEANTGPDKAPLYRYQLPALIADWRARWGVELPFAWVQLPGYARGAEWPLVREAMLQTLKVPNTGMAVTIDIGEADNIHPKNKQEVGHRLSLWALGKVYGRKVPSISGPLWHARQIKGSEIVLSFDHTDGGLVAKGGDLRGFLITAEDGQWVKANARIEGKRVIVSSTDVDLVKPVAVRYDWALNPDGNLFNGAGLPASPFRTDSAVIAAPGRTLSYGPGVKVRIALAGDSTVADGSGWGPAFTKRLVSEAGCLNFAGSGQSSKSFRETGNWRKVLDVKPDYILIQFGHNDMPGKGPNRETDPGTTYRDNLARYVDEARAAGAEPILVTSVARRIFDNGKIRGELAPWVEAMKQVAAEKKAPLVDLSGRSIELLERIGPKEAAAFDPITKTGQHDGTHLNPKGGEAMVALMVDELRRVEPKLAALLKP